MSGLATRAYEAFMDAIGGEEVFSKLLQARRDAVHDSLAILKDGDKYGHASELAQRAADAFVSLATYKERCAETDRMEELRLGQHYFCTYLSKNVLREKWAGYAAHALHGSVSPEAAASIADRMIGLEEHRFGEIPRSLQEDS